MRFSISLLSLIFAPASRAAQCFTSKGDLWVFNPALPIEGWVPCNSTASVTNCCSPRDYCMSNGLCMDAVVDNMITQQGCTSENWDAQPCHNYCKGKPSDPNGYHFLWRCRGQSHCCSLNATTSCCDEPGVDTFLVEVGQAIHMPGMVAVSQAVLASLQSLASMTATRPNSSVATGTSTSGVTTPTMTTATGDVSKTAEMPQIMVIGLAIGIALAVLLITAIAFFGVQIRRRNQISQSSMEKIGTGPHSSLEHDTGHHGSTFSQQQQGQHHHHHQGHHQRSTDQQYAQELHTQGYMAELGERNPAELYTR